MKKNTKADQAYFAQYRKSIQDEYNHLHNRMVVLSILDTLFMVDPPFYDDDNNEFAEPWKAMIDCYSDVFDEDDFIAKLQSIHQQKHKKPKAKSAKRRTK